MKALLLIALLAISPIANSTVLCQSMADHTYKAWFPGYSCPSGYYFLRVK